MINQQNAWLAAALESAANAILITDDKGCIVWLNHACTQLTGYSKDESIGQTPHLWSSGKQAPEFYQSLWETIHAGQPWQGELVERRQNGSLYVVNQVITPLLDDAGQITHYIAIQNDITARNHEEKKIHQLAYHDFLTGLPNRALFLDRLTHAMTAAHEQHKPLVLMFIDLNGFKKINDTLGHAVGDLLLVAVAERLRAAIRQTDTVARLGGDEFTILLTDVDGPEVASALAEKLVSLISQPFMLEHKRVETSISIGISLYPHDAQSADDLLNKADIAMYQAKTHPEMAYVFFDPAQSTVEN